MDDTPNTDDLRELLTEAERMALDAEEGAEINGSASLEPDDEDDKEVELGWREAATGAEAEADEEATAGQEADTGAAAQPEQPEQPAAEAIDATALQQQMEAKKAERADIFDQYEDGDLTREELDTKLAEIDDAMAQIAQQRATAQQQYEAQVAAYNNTVGDYLKQYPGLKEAGVVEAYDAEVRAVQSSPHFQSKPLSEQLAIAHKRLAGSADDYGIKVPAPAKAGAAAKASITGDELHTPPTTLAQVPAASLDADGGKFAALDRVMFSDTATPEQKEQALARLSDEERDAYLAEH